MYNLNKFIKAQEESYEGALKEIKKGKKLGHWIWYIFPQLKGLGFSNMSYYYGLDGIEEAKEYLNNEYLRNHLLEITKALLDLDTNDPLQVLGFPDNLKVNSCMTLFYYTAPNITLFKDVIDKFYEGRMDENTINILNSKIKKKR